MLLADWEIRALCVEEEWNRVGYEMRTGWGGPVQFPDGFQPMLSPFSEGVTSAGTISFGLSHSGYDLRLADQFVFFRYSEGMRINPKAFKNPDYQKMMVREVQESHELTIPPNSYVLGRSLEYIRIPKYLKGRCTGKSTYARSGILINTTPLEPGWHGHLCIEIGNVTHCPAVIFPGEGIAQLEFELVHREVESDYSGKKYQGQTGVTLAKV